MTKRGDTDTEVLEVAVELHAKDEAERDAQRARQAVREAAEELGIEEQLARAEEEVERRRAAAEERRARRGRLVRMLAGAVLAIGIGIAFWQITTPAPPTPWTITPERAGWVLDTSPGSEATVSFETHAGHEVAVVSLTRVTPRADGTWFVNLDRMNVPAFAGHAALSIELAGTLPYARVYLEAGSDERWRSPPIAVQPDWTTHRLPLASFEHQLRDATGWRVVGGAAPAAITTVSIKLGHFVNSIPRASGAPPGSRPGGPGGIPADTTGLVRVGPIHAE